VRDLLLVMTDAECDRRMLSFVERCLTLESDDWITDVMAKDWDAVLSIFFAGIAGHFYGTIRGAADYARLPGMCFVCILN
jgi:hypothetical protein